MTSADLLKQKNYRGFKIQQEILLDWYTIDQPATQFKSQGYKARRLQNKQKQLDSNVFQNTLRQES